MERPLKVALTGVALLFATTAIALVQWHFVERKIPVVTKELYAERASELAADEKWRYGYMGGMHGYRLVRVENMAAPANRSHSLVDSEIHSRMHAELEAVVRKAALEGILYLVLVTVPVILLLRVRFTKLWMPFIGGAMWFAVAVFPLFIWGYG